MAKRMTISVDHDLATDDAHERMRALGDFYQNRHGAEVRWEGPRGHITAKYLLLRVHASLVIGDGSVQLEGPDPGFMLRKKASDYLQGKLRKYLDPATPVDALSRG